MRHDDLYPVVQKCVLNHLILLPLVARLILRIHVSNMSWILYATIFA